MSVVTGQLQRAAITPSPVQSVPPVLQEVLRSSGQPLDAMTRSFMEPRFGHDFSGVRVHTDTKAAESARAVNALAYTVGRDIAFDAGQYTPQSSAGRKLLAHELTHVLQQSQSGGATTLSPKSEIVSPDDASEQEAEAVARRILDRPPAAGQIDYNQQRSSLAGTLQRTPAPPDYGGVTGNRDLSKLRIDPVPDLVAGSFTTPLDVHAHVIDPAIVHLTWMLYDPNDQMVTGYSTLPKAANATTKPFTLKPSHFSGAGFVEGKYILRCTGLNDKHQPVAYADRDIIVMNADLTTNTDLATTYGKLTFTKYASTDASPPATPNYKAEVELKFLPDTKVACDDVTYIQTIESVDDTGKSQHRFSSAEKEARQTPLAWSIDQLAGVPSPYYIVSPDLVTGAMGDVAGYGKAGKGGRTPSAATLSDSPQWNKATHDKFETCVMCRSGANKGQIYGCATWGFTTTAAGKVTLHPRSFRQTPSDQFKEATDAWNKWRATIAAARRPSEVPALKTP